MLDKPLGGKGKQTEPLARASDVGSHRRPYRAGRLALVFDSASTRNKDKACLGPTPTLSLRRTGKTPDVTGEDPEISRLVGTARPKRLFCRVCGHPVTNEEHRTTIEGRHVHHRINPAGFEFEIGCFAEAGGAVARGVPTTEHSWFLPYAWSYSLCRGCGCHLGWFFEGGDPSFHGLVLNRLEAEEEPAKS